MLFLLAFVACYYCYQFDTRFMTTKHFLREADELGLELGRRLKEKKLPGASLGEFLPRVVEVAASVLSGKKSGPVEPELARAKLLARGVLARRQLEEAEGGAISTEEVAENLDVTRQAVDLSPRRGSWWLGVRPRSDGDFLFGSSALTAVRSQAYPSASQRRSWTTNGPR